MDIDWALRFIGTGSGRSSKLGTSSATLERSGVPELLIDCGHGTPDRFYETYGCWPAAVFITHVHLDHVSGLEQLQSRVALEGLPPVRLYISSSILELLHERVGNLTCSQAEERSNFWDQFHLVPVSAGFWHAGHWFDVFSTRHHSPGFSYGLRLAGRFLFTGDTRPIPEILRHFGRSGERLFHDCALVGNPSHTGLDDIEREYEEALQKRMVLYHYESSDAAQRLRERGMSVAAPGKQYALTGLAVNRSGSAGLKSSRVCQVPKGKSFRVNGNGKPAGVDNVDLSRRSFE